MLISLSGCLGTRFLKEDQKLLFKQKVKGVKRIDRLALDDLYQQTPNRKFPLIPWAPYVWIHHLGENAYDTVKYEKKKAKVEAKFVRKTRNRNPNSSYVSKKMLKRNRKIAKIDRNIREGNLLMRWGESVAVYDSTLESRTIEQFRTYMYSKGYFEAEVSSEVKSIGRLVTVNYEIDRGMPYNIDSIRYSIADTNLMTLVTKSIPERLVNVGDKYDQDLLSDERERLFNVAVNNGYFDFSRQYIQFEVDTSTLAKREVIVNQKIVQRSDGKPHKIFRIDSVNFTTDADINVPQEIRKTKKYNGVNYHFVQDKYNRRILDWRHFIYKDSVFRRSNTLNTQRQLANLDMFKFININYDSTGGQFVANIYTSPLNKYQTSGEIGVNVSQGLPGPFVNGSIKNRNVFGGLEILEFSGRFGVEGVASASENQNIYQSTEYGFNGSLLFPQFLFPLTKKWKNRVRDFEPKTDLNVGTTFTNRPEYQRNNLLGSITYGWVNRRGKIYSLSPAEISFINSSNISTPFQTFLDTLESQGNLLKNTFEPSLVSNATFSVINNFNSYGNQSEQSSFLRYSIESGGTFLNFIDEERLISSALEYYNYLKFNADFRRHNPVSTNNVFAYRINIGLAVPYGDNRILPYEKYFFAGGSNGIRAWRPRRLGPGSYTPLDSDGFLTDNFEQQGEILIETSLEMRHNILGFIDGAIFLDMGNIWTLRNDPARPGSQFEVDRFFREIAIGTGYGIRLDFSFLLLRFDTGLKIYDPARDKGGRFIWTDGFNDAKFRNADNLIFNLGIGYPF